MLFCEQGASKLCHPQREVVRRLFCVLLKQNKKKSRFTVYSTLIEMSPKKS